MMILFSTYFFLVSPHDSTSSNNLPWLQTSPGSTAPIVPPIATSSATDTEGAVIEVIAINEVINPGEYVLRTLFSEFTILAEKKIDRLMKEPPFVSIHYFLDFL